MRRAIIVGSEGQDGRLLFDHLVNQGYSVAGLGRRSARCSGSAERVDYVDVRDQAGVASLLERFRPDEVFYLAAYHDAAEARSPLADADADVWRHSLDVHVVGLLSFLEGIRTRSPHSRLFYACSSLVFGTPDVVPQNELTRLRPLSPYAITKASGWQCCAMFREKGVHACVGILYNHESPLRPERFVSQKIVRAVVRIKAGLQNELVLGDLLSEVDWGAAADFVRAMPLVLRLASADDFVIATGRSHRVADFAALAFAAVGLDWRKHVRENHALVRESRRRLIGDPSKLRAATGWVPSVSFERMVRSLVEHEIERNAAVA